MKSSNSIKSTYFQHSKSAGNFAHGFVLSERALDPAINHRQVTRSSFGSFEVAVDADL
jgi:hypothetical protein